MGTWNYLNYKAPDVDSMIRGFKYSPQTGVCYRNFSVAKYRAGPISRSLSIGGYTRVMVGKIRIFQHILGFLIMNKRFPKAGFVLDHINRKRSDNRWCNLRECTVAQNNVNRSSNKMFRGVCFIPSMNKFQASIGSDYKKKHLGYFVSEEDAAGEYDKAATALYGDFAITNFKEGGVYGRERSSGGKEI
jgi:hypothetical protein